ncbi:MAG TPA: mechanosensitive ion channel [bacterium]|nr:mechanosensitive ion channel [bacterium]HPN46281.1 mechanosensitive ion channel [bacterium]
MPIETLYSKISEVVNFVLFTLGDTKISLGSILKFVIILLIFVFLARRLAGWITIKILQRLPLREGTRYVFKRSIEYILLIIGVIIAFNSINVDLSGLAVIFGLLSVGIGFGLQNITSNFISGLILLFEQPIKVGDRVTVGDTEGDVTEINIRSTTIRTLNDISYIVPNSEFISSKVINWTYDDTQVRIDIKVGVSYNSDLDLVIQSLKEVALDNSEVLKDPQPDVLFVEFGDSAWNLVLQVWINDPKRHDHIRSDINCAIVHKFRENNIEIPFPQSDVHLYSARPVQVQSHTAV